MNNDVILHTIDGHIFVGDYYRPHLKGFFIGMASDTQFIKLDDLTLNTKNRTPLHTTVTIPLSSVNCLIALEDDNPWRAIIAAHKETMSKEDGHLKLIKFQYGQYFVGELMEVEGKSLIGLINPMMIDMFRFDLIYNGLHMHNQVKSFRNPLVFELNKITFTYPLAKNWNVMRMIPGGPK